MPGSCAPAGRRPSRRRAGGPRRASRPTGPADQSAVRGAGRVAVTGDLHRGGFLYYQAKTSRRNLTFPSCPPSGPRRNVRPIRTRRWPSSCRSGAGGCTSCCGGAPTSPSPGRGRCPGGRCCPTRRWAPRSARQLASKVEVTPPGAPRAAGDPQRPRPGPPRAHGRHRLPRPGAQRPRPRAARRHRLAPRRRPAADGVRPRLDRRVGPRAAAGQALVHQRRVRPRAADLHDRGTAGHLRRRPRVRGHRHEPAAGAAAPRASWSPRARWPRPGRAAGGRRCCTASRWPALEVTDPFAVLRPPGARFRAGRFGTGARGPAMRPAGEVVLGRRGRVRHLAESLRFPGG